MLVILYVFLIIIHQGPWRLFPVLSVQQWRHSLIQLRRTVLYKSGVHLFYIHILLKIECQRQNKKTTSFLFKIRIQPYYCSIYLYKNIIIEMCIKHVFSFIFYTFSFCLELPNLFEQLCGCLQHCLLHFRSIYARNQRKLTLKVTNSMKIWIFEDVVFHGFVHGFVEHILFNLVYYRVFIELYLLLISKYIINSVNGSECTEVKTQNG